MCKAITFFAILIFSSSLYTAQMMKEGFEDWKDTLNGEYLVDWDLGIGLDTLKLNLQKVEALSEGQFAVKLKSNIIGVEGNLPTHIERLLPFSSNLIKIKFTYKCEGEGFCHLILRQKKNNTSNGVEERRIWSVEAGDSTIHYVEIDSILVESSYDVFDIITFEARPIDAGGGTYTYGVSEFTIDALSVIDGNLATTVESTPPIIPFEIFPNPTYSLLNIGSPRDGGQEILKMELYDSYGTLKEVVTGHQEVIKIDGPDGVYYLVIRTKENSFTKRLLKME